MSDRPTDDRPTDDQLEATMFLAATDPTVLDSLSGCSIAEAPVRQRDAHVWLSDEQFNALCGARDEHALWARWHSAYSRDFDLFVTTALRDCPLDKAGEARLYELLVGLNATYGTSARPPFAKYPSLTNHYVGKLLDWVRDSGHADGGVQWVVFEKLHGCNVSFCTDGVEVWPARRSAYLAYDEKFHTVWAYVRAHKHALLALHATAGQGHTTVYGEFIGGGAYRGEGVKMTHRPIQREVLYAPDHRFVAFDVRRGDDTMLDVDDARAVCERAGVPFVAELCRGTYAECWAYSQQHYADASPYPASVGLEPPAVASNIREGHVLRPLRFTRTPGGEALVIKHKNDLFKERVATKKPRVVAERSADYTRLLPLYLGAVTKARFLNVQSKQSEAFGARDIRRAIAALAADVFEEVAREDGEAASLDVLDDKERAALEKAVKSACGRNCAKWCRE